MNLPIRAVQYAMPAVRLRIDDSDDAVNPFVSLCQSYAHLVDGPVDSGKFIDEPVQTASGPSVSPLHRLTDQTDQHTNNKNASCDRQTNMLPFGRTDRVFAFRHRYLISQLFQDTCARRK